MKQLSSLSGSSITIKHPAKYPDEMIPIFAEMLKGCNTILDPFAGSGKIFDLKKYLPEAKIYGVEIEPEWAKMRGCLIGNALALPFDDGLFDAVCTSPSYGNRMADKFGVGKWSKTRNTYAAYIGRELSKNNSASLQWGIKYREFHWRAWNEIFRVLKRGALFVLNIKNHIRNNRVQDVTEWHINTIYSIGFHIIEHKKVNVQSYKRGENYNNRVDYESIILFQKEDMI